MSDKSKNILLGVLIVGLVSMTVAYAALSTSLTINGTANVSATTWDIHFANVAVDNGSGKTNISNYSLGTLDGATTNTTGTAIAGLTATLNKPGDKLVVNFDIVNAGTIDAKVSSFAKHIAKGSDAAITGDTNDVVNYTITCTTGGNEDDDLLKLASAPSNTSSCVLTLEYTGEAASVTQPSTVAGQNQTVSQDAKTFTVDANWTYVQK